MMRPGSRQCRVHKTTPSASMPTCSPFVYLASQSPRRRELLRQLGVESEVLLPPDAAAAEALEALRPREAAAAYVQRVTGLKLEAAVRRLESRGEGDALVLAADTTVTLDRGILGKPADEADAASMLRALSGRTHRVLTAVAVAAGAWRGRALSVSRVRFAVLRQADIAAYIASDEWRGKAGGYAIQGRAAAFVAHLSGSYSGVMGLPLHETADLLRAARSRLPAR